MSILETLSTITKFDAFETIFGIMLGGLVIRYYRFYYYGFEGEKILGIVLSMGAAMAVISFAHGIKRWNERYKDERETERIETKLKREKIEFEREMLRRSLEDPKIYIPKR